MSGTLSTLLGSSAHSEKLAWYTRIREVGMELNSRIMKTLSQDAIRIAAKNLGMLEGKTIVMGSENESSVLMDYCFHDVHQNGTTVVQRYLAQSDAAPDTDERIMLEAMCQARFAILMVESVERGVGVHVRDLFRDEPLFLMDVGFSHTASPGYVLACRIMAPNGIWMTTGAALPIGVLPPAERQQFVTRFQSGIETSDPNKLSTAIIRQCLQTGAGEQIVYAEPGQKIGPTREPRALSSRIGRNDPCPCGSGKKFKRCCANRTT